VTRRLIRIAGLLAMISAFVSIPMAWMAFRLELQSDPAATNLIVIMQTAGTVLFVAITLLLRRFLNRIFLFHDTDKSIDLMIMANVIAGILVVGGMYMPQLKDTAGIATLVMMVFQGVVQLQFGYKLLKLPNNLDGLLKPFCYLNIVTGVCVASIVLILPGVVVSAISDLMLGTIFFNVSKQLDTKA